MNTDKATKEMFAALAVAQGEIGNATKASANSHFRSKYADLAEILNTVRPVFSKHGLSLIQSTGFDGAMVAVDTVIAHSSGGVITSRASCVPAKTDAQGIGAATTYLRRYSAAAMAGIAQEDDDGNAAAHNGAPAVAPNPAEVAALADFRAAIDAATTEDELAQIAADIAGASLSPAGKKTLRDAFSARKKAVQVAA